MVMCLLTSFHSLVNKFVSCIFKMCFFKLVNGLQRMCKNNSIALDFSACLVASHNVLYPQHLQEI